MIGVRIVDRSDFGTLETTYTAITKRALFEYQKKATKHPIIDWSSFSPEIKHLVFYAELRNNRNTITYADIYLNGACEPCTEARFEEIYAKNPKVFVIAKHRR